MVGVFKCSNYTIACIYKNMFSKKISFFILLIIFAILFCFNLTLAADLGDAFLIGDEHSFLDEAADSAGYDTGDDVSVETTISTIIQTALTFLGVVFLILAIYGGYLWMTARGNEEQLTRAKNTLTAAVVGLIIVIGAYAISYFVIERLGVGTLK